MDRIAETVEAYQAQLEHYRAAQERDFEDEFLADLLDDLEKAQRAMEVAWLDGRLNK